MTSSSVAAWRFAAFSGATVLSLLFAAQAFAQFNPPSTVFGSISDAAGPVQAGLPVEAYIDDKLCGEKGRTEFTGEGSSRVTVYVVDVVSESQTPGCGKDGKEIKIKIGDRFAAQVAKWSPGPVQLDLTFGNATPVPIPTFTPAPTRTPDPAATPVPGQTPGQTPAQIATIPAGSPGAGSPVPTVPRGGITSATPGQAAASGGGNGGVPIWAIVLLVLGGIGAVGGGVGYYMARGNRDSGNDDFSPPGEE
jgi:hypothetical protein